MPSASGRRKGGAATAKKLREEAIRRYDEDPNNCLNCDSVIRVIGKQKVPQVRCKKFCDRSCAAKYNNAKYPQRTKKRFVECRECNTEVECKKLPDNRGYSRRNFCDLCRWSETRRATLRRTKKNIFESHSTWNGAAAFIRKHARRVFDKSGIPHRCAICGYEKHIHVSHIIEVSSFPESSTVAQMNSIDNLAPLCPTHHWEFDNNKLEKKDEDTLIDWTNNLPIWAEKEEEDD